MVHPKRGENDGYEMSNKQIERQIQSALDRASSNAPATLAEAMGYAVFPGGGRVRPLLTLATAEACGAKDSPLAFSAATAIELIHCASLVHDDMPAFDNAALRRGKASLFRVYGEPMALLVGDALISLAFEELGYAAMAGPEKAAQLIRVVARGIGASHGIIGGQAWELEEQINIEKYHRAKTGALFEAACVAGAVAAGVDGEAWRELGQLLGEAYQLADDLADVLGDSAAIGKAVGQDGANHAPNAVHRLGVLATVERLEQRIAAAQHAVPACVRHDKMQALIERVGHRLCPPQLRRGLEQEIAESVAA